MATEREFDAAALEEYRQFLLELLDELENDVIPVLDSGTLSRAPAFGSAPGAAENAVPGYLVFHATTWRNLQYVRGALHGLTAALAEAAEHADEGQERASLRFTSIEGVDGDTV